MLRNTREEVLKSLFRRDPSMKDTIDKLQENNKAREMCARFIIVVMEKNKKRERTKMFKLKRNNKYDN